MPTPETLTDRMLARVKTAQRAIHRRAGASRPQLERRRRARPADLAPESVEDGGGAESLKQVFRDLGVSYRRYRSRTGTPLAPGLRAATDRFRAKPSLPSLVAVAAILDELELLS
jgi:hypothetical protein